jgi:acyl carrier protein
MTLKKTDIDKLRDIFKKILNQNDKNFNNLELGTKNWDSLKHIQLIINIEKKFNVKIKTSEVFKLSSYNKILKFLEKN